MSYIKFQTALALRIQIFWLSDGNHSFRNPFSDEKTAHLRSIVSEQVPLTAP